RYDLAVARQSGCRKLGRPFRGHILVCPSITADVSSHSLPDAQRDFLLDCAWRRVCVDSGPISAGGCDWAEAGDQSMSTALKRAERALPNVRTLLFIAVALLIIISSVPAFGHDISESDRAAVAQIEGVAPVTFLYLGAKHMVTGIDHILFLVGVIFFLYSLRDVIIYVSLFTLGHSLTLLVGVLMNTGANAYIVDAIIGFSVVYKGFENLGGLRKLGMAINTKLAVLVFGLFHGLGLATKVRELGLSEDALLVNLISFNVGVEV